MLAALSQPTRLRIVGVVAQAGPDGTPAGEIARAVRCPASTLSFHLKELAQAGLLSANPQGRFIRYAVVPETFARLGEIVSSLGGAGPPRAGASRAGSRAQRARRGRAGSSAAGASQLSIFEE